MKIGIIGAGFCGVAAAYYCLRLGHEVTLYDSVGIGGGASGMAAGLMHSYAGRFAPYNWMGREGMHATKELLDVASVALGEPVADFSGILRVAMNAEQEMSFRKCSEKHADVQKHDRGCFISSGVTINCPQYLKGLWEACEQLGGKFQTEMIVNLSVIDADRVIIATGAHKGLHDVPLTQVKGQILQYDYAGVLRPSLISQAYIVANFGICLAGSTFEKTFRDAAPDLETAKRELEPKVHALYPELSNHRIVGCRAGLRASCKGHLPVIKQMDARTSVITGMGSKGLLYHALFAKQLVAKVQMD